MNSSVDNLIEQLKKADALPNRNLGKALAVLNIVSKEIGQQIDQVLSSHQRHVIMEEESSEGDKTGIAKFDDGSLMIFDSKEEAEDGLRRLFARESVAGDMFENWILDNKEYPKKCVRCNKNVYMKDLSCYCWDCDIVTCLVCDPGSDHSCGKGEKHDKFNVFRLTDGTLQRDRYDKDITMEGCIKNNFIQDNAGGWWIEKER